MEREIYNITNQPVNQKEGVEDAKEETYEAKVTRVYKEKAKAFAKIANIEKRLRCYEKQRDNIEKKVNELNTELINIKYEFIRKK